MENRSDINTNLPASFEVPADKSKEKSDEKSKDKLKDKKKTSKPPVDKPKAEKAEAKTLPPLEKLAEDEKIIVAKDYIALRSQELNTELASAPAESPNEAAGLANAALLDNLANRLEDEQPVDAEVLDEAVAEVAEALGLDPIDTETQPAAEGLVAKEPAGEAEPSQPDGNQAGAAPPEADDNSSTPPGSNRAGGANNAGGGNGSRGPVVPTGPAPQGGNYAPSVSLPERRHGHAKYVLAGGIVGYFLGRRRGRIKTERELLPVQHKLEKEVTTLQQQIALREAKIRQLAEQNAVRQPSPTTRRVEQQRPQQTTETSHLPEKEQPVRAAVKAETIGRLVLQPEQKELPKAPTHEAEQATEVKLKPVITAETAPLEQVLKLAEDIKVENQNLRKLYEDGRIEQKAVRKIIKAYVRGERYDRLLSESLRPLASQEHLPRSTTAVNRADSPSHDGSAPSPRLAALINDASTPKMPAYMVAQPVQPPVEADEPFVSNRALVWSLLAMITFLIAWLLLK